MSSIPAPLIYPGRMDVSKDTISVGRADFGPLMTQAVPSATTANSCSAHSGFAATWSLEGLG